MDFQIINRNCFTDTRRGYCYAKVENGRCENPSREITTKSACCCSGSSEGGGLDLQIAHVCEVTVTRNGAQQVSISAMKGWGSPCQKCPLPGTDEHSHLCPQGSGLDHNGNGMS